MNDSRFVKAAKVSDVPPGKMLTVEVEGKRILLANVGGAYYAMGGICSHEEWDLSEGTLEDHKVTCAGHGAIWDLKTGAAEFEEPIPYEPLYDIKVAGQDILVNLAPRSG